MCTITTAFREVKNKYITITTERIRFVDLNEFASCFLGACGCLVKKEECLVGSFGVHGCMKGI